MAILRYVDNVTDLFRAYTDEPDLSFLTASDAQTYLELGYNEFRQKATDMAPAIFATDVTITPNGATYNLQSGAVSILGANPTNARMARLLSVRDASTGNDPFIWTGASSRRAMQMLARGYLLEGQSLIFSVNVNRGLILQYVPESTVDWSQNAAGNNEYIDDLVEFHDIIALMAYRQYAIRDSATSEQIERQLSQRLREMESTITKRNFDGPHYVARTNYTYED
tara:strand:+ start:9481 stop:10155 length:675 start_codon:yes stop_codon:yes gene_type:complete